MQKILSMGKINRLLAKSDNQLLKQRGYEIITVLGEGSFSVVKSAKWTKPGSTKPLNVALKIINRSTAPESFIEKFWPREEMVLSEVKHKNIVQMYEIFSERSKIFVCLELAPRGDLLQYLQLKGALEEAEAHKLFMQMCSAVEYLHGKNIAHRDLKCENVLLANNNIVKLTDFGFATIVDKSKVSETFCGSAAYAPPEVLQGIPYQPSIHDIWSLGVILFIMACNAMPFRDSNIKKLVQDQQASDLDFPNKESLSDHFCDLVSLVLYYEPEKRFGLREIKKHKWTNTDHQSSSTLQSQSSSNSLTDEAG